MLRWLRNLWDGFKRVTAPQPPFTHVEFLQHLCLGMKPESFSKILRWFDPVVELDLPDEAIAHITVAELARFDQLLAERRDLAKNLRDTPLASFDSKVSREFAEKITKNIHSIDEIVQRVRSRKDEHDKRRSD